MSRNSRVISALLAVVLLAGGAALAKRWKSSRDAQARARWNAAIHQVVDSAPAGSRTWLETFDAPRDRTLAEHDARWQPLFGRMLVDSRLAAAVGDPAGGWSRDGGDDYSWRPSDIAMSDATIVLDGYWEGQGSIGVQCSVQRDPPHRLYEATLWRGRLALLYFYGPSPDRFDVLAESTGPQLSKGFYRIVLHVRDDNGTWSLRATLHDARRNYATVGEATARDSRLPAGGLGIGILGGGGDWSSYITGVAVVSAERRN